MSAKPIVTVLVLMILVGGPVAADEIRGSAVVMDGKTMLVDGHKVQLANIIVPAIGLKCVWRDNPLDCGILARAGLQNLTAGARIVCTVVREGAHRCKAGNFDLAFGMIHAGWAVPDAGAPDHYRRKMQNAKERKRALWSARGVEGQTLIAEKLNSNP